MRHNLGTDGMLCCSQGRKANSYPRAREGASPYVYASSFSADWGIKSSRTKVLSRDDWSAWRAVSSLSQKFKQADNHLAGLQIPAGSCFKYPKSLLPARASSSPWVLMSLGDLCWVRHSWHDWNSVLGGRAWRDIGTEPSAAHAISGGWGFRELLHADKWVQGKPWRAEAMSHIRAFMWWQINHHSKRPTPALIGSFYNIRQPRVSIASLKRTQWRVGKSSNSKGDRLIGKKITFVWFGSQQQPHWDYLLASTMGWMDMEENLALV